MKECSTDLPRQVTESVLQMLTAVLSCALQRLHPHIGQDSEHYRALIQEVELSSRFDCDRLVKVLGACLKVSATCN